MEPVVVLFDSDCQLCQRARGYGDGHGRPGLLRFIPGGEEEGQTLLQQHGLVGREKTTLIALVGRRAFVESSAVVQVAKRLRFPHNLNAALWLVPRPLRNIGYRWVARHRHVLVKAK